MKHALLALAFCLAVAWLIGFAAFVRDSAVASGPDAHADGIVVLTGGADRIAAGIHLLQRQRARVLLISGVGHNADLVALLRGTGIDAASIADRITLGHEATTTTGNADETAAWAAAQNLRSLLVVTASYHMRRAITELQRSLPGLVLIPAPVLPPALRRGGSFSTLRLLAGEYTKLLAAQIWLGRLGGGQA